MARAIDHECPRYGKYPPAAGISFLEIDAGTLQVAAGEAILEANIAALYVA